MRTTLTLDDDVARLIDDAVHRERRAMKRVVNDALRRALAPSAPTEPFEVTPHRSAVRAGLDVDSLNRLADQMGDDEVVTATDGG